MPCHLLTLPCVVQVHVNSVAVCGRAERVWLLGLKWAMDRDMYTIQLLTEVPSSIGQDTFYSGVAP